MKTIAILSTLLGVAVCSSTVVLAAGDDAVQDRIGTTTVERAPVQEAPEERVIIFLEPTVIHVAPVMHRAVKHSRPQACIVRALANGRIDEAVQVCDSI